ncbi:MAG: AAA family ATPase [Prevotella sp.]|nr:AAA family ATPase [Prevotella sp.]
MKNPIDLLAEPIAVLARKSHLTTGETLAKLKERYDGYHFVENGIGIYNPFSLLNTFKRLHFGSYWSETGTPLYDATLQQINGKGYVQPQGI